MPRKAVASWQDQRVRELARGFLEADLRAEVAGVASDLKQGCGADPEEQVADHALVLEREWSEFTRQGEDKVHIAGGQQFPFARLDEREAVQIKTIRKVVWVATTQTSTVDF